MLERKKRYTEPAGKKEWSNGGQKGTCRRRSRLCFRQIKPENTIGKFSGREAVHLSLDDYLIDVKPFGDTVGIFSPLVLVSAVPPGISVNIHAEQTAIPVQTGDLKGPFHKGAPSFLFHPFRPANSLRWQWENGSVSARIPVRDCAGSVS